MCTKEMNELLDRTRRLESRMVQLGDFVGANLRAKQRIDISLPVRGTTGTLFVQIDALDVSVSRIVAELKQHNVYDGQVPVYFNGIVAFTLNLGNLQ
jgi:hypothetical protein